MALIATTAAPDDYRRKLAYKLMMEGTEASPVQHWAQGLARLGQGALGGYEMYQADEKDKASEREAAQAYAALLGGGGLSAPQAAPAAPSAPPMPTPSRPMPQAPGPMVSADPQAATGPRPGGPVQPTAKVWGDAEAEAAGLYEPAPKNAKLASALAAPQDPATLPPAAQPAQGYAIPGQPAQADPRKAKVIQMLSSGNPSERKMGLTLASGLISGEMAAPKTTDEIREFEYAQKNPAFKDYKTGMKRAGAIQNNVVIDQKGELEFSKVAGKKQAERFDELAADAPAAKQMISDVKTLTELGKQIGTGKEAQVKASLGPYAEALGIKVEGLNEIQAFEAIVNRVAPNLRVKGSGAQSDYELKNFLKSLPSLGNTAEGNALASKVMEGLYQNKITAAEIGAKAISGEITRSQAEKMLQQLPDPMEGWRAAT
ncbi:MAG: hypothetical protein Q7R45_03810, partial [Sulfuricaulis sp.]|nr:hypothetical protein [Sulfuricaulis sp.]